jgi:SprT-like family
MELEDARALALSLMAEHGLIERGWELRIGRPSSKRFGNAGTCTPRLRRIYLATEHTWASPEEEVRDTILQEIAHALTVGHGHDQVWEKKAREIGMRPEGLPDPAWVMKYARMRRRRTP